MRALNSAELLSVWERGAALPSFRQALVLLAAACPETPETEIAKLNLGQRDEQLLTLREWTFGPEFVSLALCPGCGNKLELTFTTEDIRIETKIDQKDPLLMVVEDYKVSFRNLNSNDLLAIVDSKNMTEARDVLLSRCLIDIQHNGEPQSTALLPVKIVDVIVDRMAHADPQSDIQLNVLCPTCGHKWLALFDIISFFWNEIDNWAHHILGEVHALASMYGWSESDILAMSEFRRQYYLNMNTGVQRS